MKRKNWFLAWLHNQIIGFPVETDFRDLPPWDSIRADLEIRNFLRIASRYGYTGHIKAIVANDRFDDDAPYALYVDPADSYFAATVILNATYGKYFANWPKRRRLYRLSCFLDAFFRTLDAHKDFQSGRSRHLNFSALPSPALTVSNIVISARSQYCIDKRVDSVLRESLHNQADRPLAFANAMGSTGMDPLAAALAHCQQTAGELQSIVGRAAGRNHQETKAWMAAARAVWRMIRALEQLAAVSDTSSDWPSVEAALMADSTFRRLVGPCWDVLHNDWRASVNRDLAENRVPTASVGAAIRGVFESGGIKILSEARGLQQIEFSGIHRQ